MTYCQQESKKKNIMNLESHFCFIAFITSIYKNIYVRYTRAFYCGHLHDGNKCNFIHKENLGHKKKAKNELYLHDFLYVKVDHLYQLVTWYLYRYKTIKVKLLFGIEIVAINLWRQRWNVKANLFRSICLDMTCVKLFNPLFYFKLFNSWQRWMNSPCSTYREWKYRQDSHGMKWV